MTTSESTENTTAEAATTTQPSRFVVMEKLLNAPFHDICSCETHEVCSTAGSALDGLDILAVFQVAVTGVGSIEELCNTGLQSASCEIPVYLSALLVVERNAVLVYQHEARAGQIHELTGNRFHNGAVRTDGNDGNYVAGLAGSVVRGNGVSNENSVAVGGPGEHLRDRGHIDNALVVHGKILEHAALVAVHCCNDCTGLVEYHHVQNIRVRIDRCIQFSVSVAGAVSDIDRSLALCDSPNDGAVAVERLLYACGLGFTDLLQSIFLCRAFISHNGKCAYRSDYHCRNYREDQHNNSQHDFKLQIAHYLIPLNMYFICH